MNEIKSLGKRLAAVGAKKNLVGKDLSALREIRDGLTQSLQTLKECESCGAVVTEIARLELGGIRGSVCKACGVKAFKSGALHVKKSPGERPVIHPVHKKTEKPAVAAPAHKPAHPAKPAHRPAVRPDGDLAKKTRKVPVLENLSLFGQPPPQPAEGYLPKSGITMPKAEPAVKKAAPPAEGENGSLENDAISQLSIKNNWKIGDVRKIVRSVNEMAIRMPLEPTAAYVLSEASQTGLKQLSVDEVKKILKSLQAENLIQIK